MTEQQTIDNLIGSTGYVTLLATDYYRLWMYSNIASDGTIESKFVVVAPAQREYFNLLNLAVARYFELIKT